MLETTAGLAWILFSLVTLALSQTEVHLSRYKAQYGLTQDLWTSVVVGEHMGISSRIECGAMCSAREQTL